MGFKQIIVVRADLGIGRGKLSAQVAHASLSAYKIADEKAREKWEGGGQEKVVLKVNSEKELLELFERMKREIPCVLIRDAGKTQLEPGTITCFGCGPADEKLIDKYTKELKLL